MSIRTTITLDDDVAESVKRESQTRGLSFRETLNELLRAALLNTGKTPIRTFKIRPFHMGYNPDLNHDKTEALIEYGEGEKHR